MTVCGSSQHRLVEQIVQVLQRCVDPAIDEYIVAYALESCGEDVYGDGSETRKQENSDSVVSTSRLREIFNDFCEMFHDLEENVKDQVMIEIEKVLLLNRSPPQCHSADGSSRRYEEPQNSGELESSESYSCLNKDEQFHICMDEAGGLEKENEEQYEEEMALLQSLLPDLEIHARVKREFLLNELKESNYNIQVAADKILDNPKIEADIAAWRNRQKPDRETSPIHQVDPGLKKSIVSKYHLQPVPSGTENGKANSKMKVSLYEDDEKDGGKGRVRFRENVVVSNKGEKYIIEKPPEWDGGSRGKVKSKRKGGKGFY